MSGIIKKIIILQSIILGLLASPAVAGIKVGFKFHGGWNYLSAGDINPGTNAYFTWHESRWDASQGGYRAVHSGFEFGGDINLELTRNFGIAISGGYLEISHSSQLFLWDHESSLNGSVIAGPKISAVPVGLGFYLTIPISSKLGLCTDLGPCWLFKTRYTDNWQMGGWKTAAYPGYIYVTTRVRKSGALIGLQGTISLEYKILKDIFLCLDARGRLAKSSKWEGSSVLESDSLDPFSEQGILYYESVPKLPDAPRVIMVQEAPPDGPGGDPRRAVIDFSGISLRIGVKFRI